MRPGAPVNHIVQPAATPYSTAAEAGISYADIKLVWTPEIAINAHRPRRAGVATAFRDEVFVSSKVHAVAVSVLCLSSLKIEGWRLTRALPCLDISLGYAEEEEDPPEQGRRLSLVDTPQSIARKDPLDGVNRSLVCVRTSLLRLHACALPRHVGDRRRDDRGRTYSDVLDWTARDRIADARDRAGEVKLLQRQVGRTPLLHIDVAVQIVGRVALLAVAAGARTSGLASPPRDMRIVAIRRRRYRSVAW